MSPAARYVRTPATGQVRVRTRVVSVGVPGRVGEKPESPRGEVPRSALPSAPLGPKFHPPAARAGIVSRDALVERMLGSEASVIALVAPPGYGKTTVLAQWAERLGP